MSILSEIKPVRRDRIMDVVQAAGLDVSDWAGSPTGASNPKYCYEWAFSDQQRKKFVFCLWYESCEADADGSVYHRGNARPIIQKLEDQRSPRARRARHFDELLQDAWYSRSGVRVALVDRSDTAKLNHAEEDASQAAFRQLDPVVWTLDHYEMMSGEYVLRRELGHPRKSAIEKVPDLDASTTPHSSGIEAARREAASEQADADGQMDYVCRVVYSNNNWSRPARAFEEAANSFASSRGFGHEEWLFRDEWTIGGWRYGFLQGINDSYARLCMENQPFNVTLFTLDPNYGHRYVARMFGVEVLRPSDAVRAIEEFRRLGWLDIMRAEIEAVGGRAKSLGEDELAEHILNCRFRPGRVQRLVEMPIATQDDPVRRIRRYTLCRSMNIDPPDLLGSSGGREPSTSAYFRDGTEPTWVTPEHGVIQKILRAELCAEYPDGNVRCEVNGVDVLLETSAERVFFEVKSELCTRRVIREALGQVLEYAYYREHGDHRDVRLVIVGRGAETKNDTAYLTTLREKFGIPIEYRQVIVEDSRMP